MPMILSLVSIVKMLTFGGDTDRGIAWGKVIDRSAFEQRLLFTAEVKTQRIRQPNLTKSSQYSSSHSIHCNKSPESLILAQCTKFKSAEGSLVPKTTWDNLNVSCCLESVYKKPIALPLLQLLPVMAMKRAGQTWGLNPTKSPTQQLTYSNM